MGVRTYPKMTASRGLRLMSFLLSLEGRLSLVDEGIDALVLVLGREEQIEGAPLELEAGVERGIPSEIDGLGREAGRDRRLFRDRLRELLRVVEVRGGGVHVHDEPDLFRLLGTDEATREDELIGDPFPHRACEALRAAGAGDDAEVDLGLAELRRFRCDDDVADHR